MIFYFSATGNTRHVVDEIKLEDEKVVSIEEAVKSGIYNYKMPGTDNRIGILFPTYDYGMPSIVNDFFKKLKMEYDLNPYIFYVGTFGTSTGGSAALIDHMLKKKGMKLDAKFDIRMPDTWTGLYDLSDENKVRKILSNADQEIAELKEQLSNQITGKHMDFNLPGFTGSVGKILYDKQQRTTKHLHVSDACIGCGLCAKKCPVNAIEMKDKKPVWVKETCVMCLGCLHRCPKYAIYYGNGKATNAHGQYTYEKYAKKNLQGGMS